MSFIPQAFADGAAPAAAAGGLTGNLMSFLPMIVIFALFWLLLIRPQQKKMKQHNAMLAALDKGTKVLTNGGIVGTIVKLKDDGFVELEISRDVVVTIQRAAIAGQVDLTNKETSAK